MSDELWVMSDENWVTKKMNPNSSWVSLSLSFFFLMHLFFYYIICTIYKLSRSILDPPTDLGIDQTILDFGLDWAKPKTSCIEGFFFFYYSYSFSGISNFFFFFWELVFEIPSFQLGCYWSGFSNNLKYSLLMWSK